MIYLDNAASGGFKPQTVYDNIKLCLDNSANPTRSGHKRALFLSNMIYDTRKTLCELFGCDCAERVIFTKNCTESLNIAILGSVKRGGHVITTASEHNSVLRPLYYLKSAGMIDLTILPLNKDLTITKSDIQHAIRHNTYLVAMQHVSNVSGKAHDIFDIGNYLKNTKIQFLVDGAQSAGYLNLDMEKQGIDYLCLPAHKGLCSPMGLGFLLLSKKANLLPTMYGGTGTFSESLVQPTNYPEGFESGTLPTVAIAGANGGLKYVKENFDDIKVKMKDFSALLYSHKFPENVRIRSVKNNCGIFSFNIDGFLPSEVADIFDDKYDIAVRSGFSCAPLIHKFLNSEKSGVVRASFSSFNTSHDAEMLFKAIHDIANKR